MPYDIDYDATKDRLNRAKHHISLKRASDFDWYGALSFEDTREDYGEGRFVSIGYVDRKLHVVIYTVRGETRRIISLRPADREERTFYHSWR